MCFPRGGSAKFRLADLAVVGAVVNYAATASDTLSSELGILASSAPRLILPPFPSVPRGTNGGVTLTGLVAGLGGSVLLSLTASVLLPFCPPTSSISPEGGGWDLSSKLSFTLGIAFAGFVGTLLDSLLGATLQASVVDVRSHKIIEGDGGRRVPVRRGSSSSGSPLRPSASSSPSSAAATTSAVDVAAVKARAGSIAPSSAAEGQKQGVGMGESRKIVTGRDWLSNNGVNVAMAGLTSAGAMGVAGVVWGVFV
ncbi:integral membrane protein DUF92-domain-containing protein [Phyllosticta capitalensis]